MKTELTTKQRLITQTLLAFRRISAGMTLGVRAMVISDTAVALVRHTYVPGWYFPGGAVDAGETIHDAVFREVREETGIALDAPPQLFGVYRNASAHNRDHVALFIARAFSLPERPFKPTREIAEAGFFSLDALPEGTTEATRRRIDEVFCARDPVHDW